MSLEKERNLWRIVGAVVVVLGLAVIVGAVVLMLNNDDVFDKTPSRIQAVGTAVALCGVCLLVLARLLSLLLDSDKEPKMIWAVITYGSMALGVLGGLLQSLLWMNAVHSGLQEDGFTPAQKAGLMAAGFLVMTGVISLIGDRTARQYFE